MYFVHSSFMVLFMGVLAHAHVRLTYPPARNYALDFLDTLRTIGPCGMPSGLGPVTELKEGSTFTVSWHLAYPHSGGIWLQILNSGGNVAHNLTSGGWIGGDDTTKQTQSVTLPSGFTCDNCTIRLLRQAAEWGCGRDCEFGGYTFWSCADVKIVSENAYSSHCSGHGRVTEDGSCSCQKMYAGEYCQFKDDCATDEDCGSHGSCHDTNPTTYPKMQCFCDMGWFGDKCQYESSVKSLTDLDLSVHTHRALYNQHPRFDLYHRILKESNELEVVLRVNTTTWVGIGWKPTGTPTTCQQFPVGGGSMAVPEPESEAEPESETSPEPESETSPEPESAKPESETSPEPESAKPESETSPEPESAKPESETSPEPESAKPESETSPEPESAKPESETSPEPESAKPESETSPEPESAKPESETSPEPESAKPESETSPEPESAKPESETSPEPETETSPEPESETSPEPEGEGEDTGGHPMDCQDIVIASARAMKSRVVDSYTRDRSTPQPDAFYNGKQSLTAALAYEQNGITTVLFRRKLDTEDPDTDHVIDMSQMTGIYARGQEHGKYTHHPSSGLERNTAAVTDFYRKDELKYHGRDGQSASGQQRGQFSFRFIEPPQPQTGDCRGEYKTPLGCNENQNCDYYALWEYDVNNDTVTFTVTAKVGSENKWTAIGFSETGQMAGADIVMGWVTEDGNAVIHDRFATGHSVPAKDEINNLLETSVTKLNEYQTLKFTRKRNTSDAANDVQFGDSSCFYFLYPISGGPYDNLSPGRHTNTPIASSQRICIRECKETDNQVEIKMKASMRFTNVEYSENLKETSSAEYKALSNRIKQIVKPHLMAQLRGFKSIENIMFKQGSVVADFEVVMKVEPGKEGEAKDSVTSSLKQADFSSAYLTSDTSAITVSELSVTTPFTSSVTTPTKKPKPDEGVLTDIQIFAIIGCISGAVVLIFILILLDRCCHWRREKNYRKMNEKQRMHDKRHIPMQVAPSPESKYATTDSENSNGYAVENKAFVPEGYPSIHTEGNGRMDSNYKYA